MCPSLQHDVSVSNHCFRTEGLTGKSTHIARCPEVSKHPPV